MRLSAVVVKDISAGPFSAEGKSVIFGCSFFIKIGLVIGMNVISIFECNQSKSIGFQPIGNRCHHC